MLPPCFLVLVLNLTISVIFIYHLFCRHGNDDSIMKYIKIAARLPEKTVRDVAMRCKWMMVSYPYSPSQYWSGHTGNESLLL